MEKIYNLPIDKIPLSTEEKDVFQWLYPKEKTEKTEKIEKDNNEKKTTEKKSSTNNQNKTRQYQFYVNVVSSFILIFCAVYPTLNSFWKKIIPTDENTIIFSLVKVFVVFFILYFINFMFHKYN
jgi:uncharacterized membrane protein YdbT with pleckstrin-like domain